MDVIIKMLLIYFYLLLIFYFAKVNSYDNLYAITNLTSEAIEDECAEFDDSNGDSMVTRALNLLQAQPRGHDSFTNNFKKIPSQKVDSFRDPMESIQQFLHKFLYGIKVDSERDINENEKTDESTLKKESKLLLMYPTGNILRAERFENKSGVHLPLSEFMHRGYCRLNITSDYMQTAVNAFSIFLEGSLDDVLNLPADYVLKSARTIAMMKITREKLAATWTTVKGDKDPGEVSYETLELYRPLFKYINGKEMSRLNLSDDRILTYIGTHAELDRHQVGVVASAYIKQNRDWNKPQYLNLMNNLLCGVPMGFMRRVPDASYLQLAHQVFYHIRACDPLQKRFYLNMMTRSQVLGKSYSWSARDVARLGLLLPEVEEEDLAAINPEAISGITAHVMVEMPARSLKYLTELQISYLGQKSLIIYSRKLKKYNQQKTLNHVDCLTYANHFVIIFLALVSAL